MAENFDEFFVDENDSFDVMGLIRKFLSYWRKILIWVGVFAVIGLVIAFSIPKTYVAFAKLAPEIAQKSNSMNSLAALAGLNLNTIAVTDAMYPDLYPEIVSSVPFKADLFSMPVEVKTKKETINTDLYDYTLNYTKSPWWSSVISFPFRVLGWIKSIGMDKAEPVTGYADIDTFRLTKEQGKVIKALGGSISASVDKKTYVITISTSAQDAKVSADLCQQVIDNLKKYVVNYRTEKSRHDLAYYEQLYESARKEYFDAQQRYARYVDANQGVVLQRVLIERERLQNDANLKYQVYNTTAQQVQQAKAKVQLETPVCAVLQPPTVPLKKAKPSKAKFLLGFMVLGFIFGTVWYMWGKEFFAALRSRKDDGSVAEEITE